MDSGHETFSINAIHQSLLAGLFGHIAHNDPEAKSFRMAGNRLAQVHPASVLRRKPGIDGAIGAKRKPSAMPAWVMAAECIDTGQVLLRQVAPIDPQWIIHLAGERLDRHYRDAHYDPQRGQVVCRESITWKGLSITASRWTSYRRIDPQQATELFIQQALIDQQLSLKAHWWTSYQRMRRQIDSLAARLRQPTLQPDDNVFVEHFTRIFGDTCIAGHKDLQSFIKRHGTESLQLSWRDIGLAEPYQRAQTLWPTQIPFGDAQRRISYRLCT